MSYVANKVRMNIGITYEIRDKNNPDLVYYGSSELSLDERMKLHIDHFNTWKKTGKKYCSSFKVLELNNYKYDIIDIVYFDTKYELREYERPLIEGQVCVNERIPNRKPKEWYEVNKEKKIKQVAEWRKANPNYDADYYEANKEHINKKFVCGCGGKYSHQHKKHHEKTKIHQDWLKISNTKNK